MYTAQTSQNVTPRYVACHLSNTAWLSTPASTMLFSCLLFDTKSSNEFGGANPDAVCGRSNGAVVATDGRAPANGASRDSPPPSKLKLNSPSGGLDAGSAAAAGSAPPPEELGGGSSGLKVVGAPAFDVVAILARPPGCSPDGCPPPAAVATVALVGAGAVVARCVSSEDCPWLARCCDLRHTQGLSAQLD